jgi:hypothetical protein
MPTFCLAICVTLVLTACGGDDSGEDAESGFKFHDEVPTEQALCSLTPGVSMLADVERVLGEPTHYSATPRSVSLQYWYGSREEFGRGNTKIIAVSFNADGILESPLLDGIQLPSCWRARSNAGN